MTLPQLLNAFTSRQQTDPPVPRGGPAPLDLVVDLGTATTRVHSRSGPVSEGASVVAVRTGTNKVLAIGEEARLMLGRTPPGIVATSPLRHGAITDFEAASRLLWHLLGRRRAWHAWGPPRVMVTVPVLATSVERRALEDALHSAGARHVRMLPKPMAAAIGAGLPVWDGDGCMVIDVGAGTADVAAFAFGSMVASASTAAAGDTFDEAIAAYLEREHGLALGVRCAEAVKTELSRAAGVRSTSSRPVTGRDAATGRPRTVQVTMAELAEVTAPYIRLIADAVGVVLEQSPASVADDIARQGLVLTGGGSLMGGLRELLAARVGMPVHPATDATASAIRGARRYLSEAKYLPQQLLPV
ncbi:rod shape-determining protein [Streptomyces sp. H10-C2]|uniref:rod shape-determining protein n=1 Tax=unclassified Streptomyces TaxID=2593676 RepID=UPI0024BA1B5C|nr:MULTISPECIES: rod shape-determining protein [unclassified Streptomyces]MDJ0345917.1 rod shape-determining protein [Streptomyces sp. PH10-H1]MDJ0374766.1 rod shape-determining protein [Streptomyces sp. H10-C2]